MEEGLIEYQWQATRKCNMLSLIEVINNTGINPRSSKLINPLLASELDTTGGGT